MSEYYQHHAYSDALITSWWPGWEFWCFSLQSPVLAALNTSRQQVLWRLHVCIRQVASVLLLDHTSIMPVQYPTFHRNIWSKTKAPKLQIISMQTQWRLHCLISTKQPYCWYLLLMIRHKLTFRSWQSYSSISPDILKWDKILVDKSLIDFSQDVHSLCNFPKHSMDSI